MKTKEHILSTIRTHKTELNLFGVQAVGLFGSYARGEQSNKSDIDILIDFCPDQENFDNYMALCDYLDNLFQDEKIEIITKNGLSAHIGTAILEEVLYV